jgi:uncharacterized iron-regulated membrane protein
MNWRIWNRKIHRWGALIVALPFLIVILTGILLQVKKQFDWIQPPTQKGESNTPEIGFEQLLAAARSEPRAMIADWSDVERIDIQPSKGIAKIQSTGRWEVQVDLASGKVLQTAFRRSDLIESLHDGSWFHPSAKLFLFLPVAIIVMGLWITGIYLFFLPILAKRHNARKRLKKQTPHSM